MEKEVNILDYINVIKKWERYIISFTVTVALLTFILCILMPKTYKAETTILLPQQNGKSVEGLIALTSMMTNTTMNFPTDIAQSFNTRKLNFSDIIKSRTLAEMIVDNLHLTKYYRASKEKIVTKLQKRIKVKEQKGILKIYVTEKDPRLAADIANYSVIALDEFNKKGNLQFARRFKNFIRDQLAVAKIDLGEAEEKLKKYETQSQMVRISEKEIILSRLFRDVKVQEAIYTMLFQEYEKSKIDEVKEELFFEVLDPAKTPVSPNSPKPILYILLSVLLGATTAIFIAFFIEYIESLGVKIPQIDEIREAKWFLTKRS